MQANRSTFRRMTELIAGIISGFLLLLLGFVLLIAYGLGEYPKRFQARVPMTNMRDVERVLGRPVSVSSYPDGTVRWDYTHWWSGTARVYFKTNGEYFRTFTEF
jgi:hypothetical protein